MSQGFSSRGRGLCEGVGHGGSGLGDMVEGRGWRDSIVADMGEQAE